MSRPGMLGTTLLDELHAEGCQRRSTFTKCQPVVVPAGANREPTYINEQGGAELVVVLMEWCSECGAAAWEVV